MPEQSRNNFNPNIQTGEESKMKFDYPVRETVVVNFNPKTVDIKDIFENQTATALWIKYRTKHIISQYGLEFLNEKCREIISKNIIFDEKSAKKFLESFLIDMAYIESSRLELRQDWIDETVNYLIGNNIIILVQKSSDEVFDN